MKEEREKNGGKSRGNRDGEKKKKKEKGSKDRKIDEVSKSFELFSFHTSPLTKSIYFLG